MTAAEIVTRLFVSAGPTPDRVLKAQALAQRMKVSWPDVLAAMSPEQRAAVEGT